MPRRRQRARARELTCAPRPRPCYSMSASNKTSFALDVFLSTTMPSVGYQILAVEPSQPTGGATTLLEDWVSALDLTQTRP